ncbi:MAG TPA: HAMP domain-containing sensor histidine kinase, partial [Hyphomicrobiales bacterium]|nr:HAMP domain-containing sensor histidine kinase [Hyphomicrobiales bacterium]
ETAAKRSRDIELTLKRLVRLSERLMQLARAEGGRLRRSETVDLRSVATLIADEILHGSESVRATREFPQPPVISDIDPDAFGILCRNLIENALRHGAPDGEISISLTEEGVLTVINDGSVVAPEVLARLTDRFERGQSKSDGSGLGLAIVRTLAERLGGSFELLSPAPGRTDGFAARLTLPLFDRPEDGTGI